MGTKTKSPSGHIGYNIKRLRDIKGMKQETMALELGAKWDQRKVSLLESQDEIDSDILEQVAKILSVTPEMIQNFDERTVNTFFNTFNDSSVNQGAMGNLYHCTFNPLDKVIELYERLLVVKAENDVLREDK